MAENEIFDITIVGGGPVGLYGLYYAGLRKMKAKIIEALPEFGGQVTALYPEKHIYDVAGFPAILGRDLIKQQVEQALQYNPTVCLGEKVLELRQDGNNIQLITEKGEHLSKTVVIAAGVGAFSLRKLPTTGLNEFVGKGVYYVVKRVEDFRDKRVLIVGGGDTALDWAVGLEPIAKKITLIHRLDNWQGHEDTVDKIYHSSVDVLFPFYEMKEVYGKDCVEKVTVRQIKTKETFDIEVDAIIVNVGFIANIGPIKNWGLELEKNNIVVDEKMQTNVQGVLGAGDIVTHSAKMNLIAQGYGEIAAAVNLAKHYIDPKQRVQPQHSTHMKKEELGEAIREKVIVDGNSLKGGDVAQFVLKMEKEIANFYHRAASKINKKEVEEAFQKFGAEKEEHCKILEGDVFPKFTSGEYTWNNEMGEKLRVRLERSVNFPSQEKDVILTAQEALQLGLEAEQEVIGFCRKAASAVQSPEGSQIFRQLAEADAVHLQAILELQEDLED
jgi:thioredoxin reductase (NADPH)